MLLVRGSLRDVPEMGVGAVLLLAVGRLVREVLRRDPPHVDVVEAPPAPDLLRESAVLLSAVLL